MLPVLFITRETKMQGLGSDRKLEQSKDQSPGLAALRIGTTVPNRALDGLPKPLPATQLSCCTRKAKKDPGANTKLEEQEISCSVFELNLEIQVACHVPKSFV